VTAIHRGRINPQSIHPTAFPVRQFDAAAFVRLKLLATSGGEASLASIEPPFAEYRRSKQALARYMQMARLDGGEALPFPSKTVDTGQIYAGVPRLFRLLRLLGDLSATSSGPTDMQVYDSNLAVAVKRFQRRHGLEVDGRLGPATIRQLNVPLQNRVRQLQLSLERWRWLPDGISGSAIFVNIPDFTLRAMNQNDLAMKMRVVVGRAQRTQTPVLDAEMTYIIFRPYWNVPRAILRNEILPATQRDLTYLESKQFEVTTWGGEIVAAHSITDEVLAQLRQRKLTVRQRPGPGNSLGLVKLMFPNESNVYLHDTPSRNLFARSRRDFSHGCIRVEKPAELAAWVLRSNPGWTLEKVQQAMQGEQNNLTVVLARPVPVFILYTTASVCEDGETHFSDDIYGFDKTLWTALARGYPYP
jgi:murein L,D-transpeptidase YcbB/YkuD